MPVYPKNLMRRTSALAIAALIAATPAAVYVQPALASAGPPSVADLSAQLRWHGRALTKEDWKLLFMDALDREYGAVRSLDGTGFVSLGKASSDLSIAEASDMIELIYAFGAQHAVVWRNENAEAAA